MNKIVEAVNEAIQNFSVLPYDEARSILTCNLLNSGLKKVLVVVAGPNGSGKSTLIANMYNTTALKDIRYLNADIFAKVLFNYVENDDERNKKAMEYTTSQCKKLMDKEEAIIYETVFSYVGKLDLVKEFKNKGYKIISIFVSTLGPNINVERVAKRVKEGGHNVPTDKIISRYARSNENKSDLFALSDITIDIDNSYSPMITSKTCVREK